MSQDWKDKYLCGFAPTAPVWGGAPWAVQTAAQGASGYGSLSPEEFRIIASTWPVSYWNMPRTGDTPGELEVE